MPFVIRANATGEIVGSDPLFQRRGRAPAARRSATPGTRGARSARPINTECKLLLLTHAFEVLGCIAVEFRTNFFNFPSRRAIERLGAKQDGILRNHQIQPDGTLRDTVVFSVIAGEWPAVKRNLQFLLERPDVPAMT